MYKISPVHRINFASWKPLEFRSLRKNTTGKACLEDIPELLVDLDD